jgi:hypothetical protein
MLRTPSAIEGQGGAITEKQSRERGRMLQVRDQMAQLAAENGLKVSAGVADSLLPTPAVGHIRNHDEPIEDYMARRQKMEDGEYKGMPGVSLGVAVRMEMLPTVKARDSNPEGYEAGLRRGMPQLGTMVKAIVDGDDRLDLLPTPNTMEHREIKTPEQIAEMKAKSPGGYRNLRESVINELLPTPIVRDYKDGSAAQERDGKVSTDTVARAIFNSGEVLLGTPRTSAANSPSSKEVQNGAEKARLEDQVKSANEGYISWGKFEPAIHRWEQVLGRDAPAPTKPDGKDGNHRLAAEFTEWMMGLPAGHVTDPALGLTRVEMLKLCGNGVVPQQAKLALQILLEGVDW